MQNLKMHFEKKIQNLKMCFGNVFQNKKNSRIQNLKCIIEKNSKIQKYDLKVQIQKCIKKKFQKYFFIHTFFFHLRLFSLLCKIIFVIM